MKTGCRVCRLVRRVTRGNGYMVVVDSRVPRLVNVSSQVVMVYRKRGSNVLSGSRMASRGVVLLTDACRTGKRSGG